MADGQIEKELKEHYFERRGSYPPGKMVLLIKGEAGIDEFFGDRSAEAMGHASLEGHDDRKYDLIKNDSYLIMQIPFRNPNIR